MSAPVILDCRGLYCPVPILRTADAMRRLSEGAEVELLADDPGIAVDLPDWCRGAGHELVRLVREGEAYTGRIRKRMRRGRP